jgi:calcineurin-like phosphoesterase family protein
MLWFTSDHHFLEKNIIKIDNRPYKSMSEMINDFIFKSNCLVHPNDTVYYLGDIVSKYAHINSVQKILRRLKGKKKILICGNHDEHSMNWYKRAGFHEVYKNPLSLKLPVNGKKQRILFSHEPYKGEFYLNIHGHNHSDIYLDIESHANVAVHLHNGYPQNLEMILTGYNQHRENKNGTSKNKSTSNG